MSKSFRTFLFTFFSAIFVIFGIVAVFYSRGYKLVFPDGCSLSRLNQCSPDVEKTGGIYIETEIKGVEIAIDGKEKKDASGIIRNGTLIKGMTPKTHDVRIGKEGYFTWQKKIRVSPEEVTEIENVVLIPLNPEAVPVFDEVIESQTINESANGKFILQNKETGVWNLYETSRSGPAVNLSSAFSGLKRGAAKTISFHPYDANKFLVQTALGIEVFDMSRLVAERVISPEPSIWSIKNNAVYYLTKSDKYGACVLSVYRLVMRTTNKIYEFNECPDVADIQVGSSQIALLEKNGRLSLYDETLKTWKEIAHEAAGISAFSPDGGKLAFWDKNAAAPEVKVYFVKNWQDGIRKNAGEIVELNSSAFPGEINAIYWHKSSFHLFVEEKDEKGVSVIFTELDDRLPLNYYRLFSGLEDAEYNVSADKLYFMQGEKIWEAKI